MVTASLVGTKKTTSIKWRYDKDIVVICYDSNGAKPEEFGQVIRGCGYKIEVVDPKTVESGTVKRAAWKVPIPDDAPQFFRDSFAAARSRRRPMIIDFWASWCGPCKQLKKITFTDKKVKSLLERCQVIYVELDEHPKLAEYYGVTAVPDVFLVNQDGLVVDRVQNFEPPELFQKRVLNLLAPETNGRG